MAETMINSKDQEVFKQIGDIADDLRTNAVKNCAFTPVGWLTERLHTLTGAYMYISTRYAVAKTARDNNEISAYIQAKNLASAGGEKFTSAVGEREARAAVGSLVEAEKLFESYKEASEQGILTIKKLLELEMLEKQRETR